jgi:hypothetical protein
MHSPLASACEPLPGMQRSAHQGPHHALFGNTCSSQLQEAAQALEQAREEGEARAKAGLAAADEGKPAPPAPYCVRVMWSHHIKALSKRKVGCGLM